jgi:hypothetical protein
MYQPQLFCKTVHGKIALCPGKGLLEIIPFWFKI